MSASSATFSRNTGRASGLDQEVVRPPADRIDRVVEAPVRGDEQRRRVGQDLLADAEQLEAGDFGKLDVRDHDVPLAAENHLLAFRAGGRVHHLVPIGRLQPAHQQPGLIDVILDQEDADLRRRLRRSLGAHGSSGATGAKTGRRGSFVWLTAARYAAADSRLESMCQSVSLSMSNQITPAIAEQPRSCRYASSIQRPLASRRSGCSDVASSPTIDSVIGKANDHVIEHVIGSVAGDELDERHPRTLRARVVEGVQSHVVDVRGPGVPVTVPSPVLRPGRTMRVGIPGARSEDPAHVASARGAHDVDDVPPRANERRRRDLAPVPLGLPGRIEPCVHLCAELDQDGPRTGGREAARDSGQSRVRLPGRNEVEKPARW